MTVKHITLNTASDTAPLQTWFDDNDTVTILCILNQSTDFYIFYE